MATSPHDAQTNLKRAGSEEKRTHCDEASSSMSAESGGRIGAESCITAVATTSSQKQSSGVDLAAGITPKENPVIVTPGTDSCSTKPATTSSETGYDAESPTKSGGLPMPSLFVNTNDVDNEIGQPGSGRYVRGSGERGDVFLVGGQGRAARAGMEQGEEGSDGNSLGYSSDTIEICGLASLSRDEEEKKGAVCLENSSSQCVDNKDSDGTATPREPKEVGVGASGRVVVGSTGSRRGSLIPMPDIVGGATGQRGDEAIVEIAVDANDALHSGGADVVGDTDRRMEGDIIAKEGLPPVEATMSEGEHDDATTPFMVESGRQRCVEEPARNDTDEDDADDSGRQGRGDGGSDFVSELHRERSRASQEDLQDVEELMDCLAGVLLYPQEGEEG